MVYLLLVGLVILAYCIGSISSAIVIGRIFYNTDVRDHGSKNAGFTNAVRVLGWKAGTPVFIFDVFKGFAATVLLNFFKEFTPGTTLFVNYQLLLGIAVLLGHIFPVYFGFKGGKGVATLLGILLGIIPIPTLICLAVFLVVFLTTRYVSLSSMISGIVFPIVVIFIFKTPHISLSIFSIMVSVLLLLTHQKNIKRLIRREELRISFKRNS